MQFLNRSQKPDRTEFIKISQAVGMGFAVGGLASFCRLGADLSLTVALDHGLRRLLPQA